MLGKKGTNIYHLKVMLSTVNLQIVLNHCAPTSNRRTVSFCVDIILCDQVIIPQCFKEYYLLVLFLVVKLNIPVI